MKSSLLRILVCSAATVALGVGMGTAQDLTRVSKTMTDYTPVTQERLNAADPSDWLLPKGNYQGWMYSALKQVTTENVSQLKPVWVYSTGLDSGHQAPPMVNDGVMFVSTDRKSVV